MTLDRRIENSKYLKYLLQSLNVNDLKDICKTYDLKGYSKLKKAEMIDFIDNSLAKEEIADFIKNKELEILSVEIDLAIRKIDGKERETIENIIIKNAKNHEVELKFTGFNWETNSYLSIRKDNIDDPERDCDCRTGVNQGLCSHFWVGFIFSLKEGFFNLNEWTLTNLPDDFEKRMKFMEISKTPPEGENKEETITLINKGSDSWILMSLIGEAVSVYEGEITEVERKEFDFQGNITISYLVSLKNVKIGPRLKKASEYHEADIKFVDELKVRLSENLYNPNDVQKEKKLKFNGRMDRDDFLRTFVIKNVRKIEVI